MIARLLSQVSVRCATSATSATSVNRAANRSVQRRRDKETVCPVSFCFVLRPCTWSFMWTQDLAACKSCQCLCSSCLCSLWFIFNLSFHLPQLPPLPLLYLFLTESSGGLYFVSFQVLSVSRFSCKVGSREQLAESGPRWPPSLRPPPFRTGLRPRKPLARR